ncbi:aminotransferase [Portibacter lacus]|uniref:Aminotransferase n=2 Tax=Portibacter lacus TaxID=1099794 RepID=A0AA37SSL6_9BACT|nr:aminotransferase class I/II-fold pyridoxal phosphate-dependent enzyme [Portibacter lacus]GLR19267.1 aminotransferase [Portibacter lacus]
MIVKQASRLNHVKEYYFSHKLREVGQMNADGKDVINLGIGKPDLAPPAEAVTALKNAAENDSYHGYQSYSGLPELRKAFADWYLKYFDTTLNPASEILPLIGSKEGIMHITMSFLEKGDQVLIPNPGYPAYESAAKLSGAESVLYNLTAENNWLPNFKELEAMDLSKVKLMWINYPNMPTGARGNKETFEKLVALCKENSILLCHDNPYSFILNKEQFSILSIEGAMDCCLELNSLSKSHNMSGWRVGMLGGRSDYIQTILKFKSNMDSGMFRALQEGAIAALSMDQAWFDSLTETYTERKVEAEKIIDLLGCSYKGDQSGMFLWAKIQDHYKDAIELADEILYGANVFITPGNIFGSNGNRYIRISLCQPSSLLAQARERIEKFKLER